jgi:hypothetical protein
VDKLGLSHPATGAVPKMTLTLLTFLAWASRRGGEGPGHHRTAAQCPSPSQVIAAFDLVHMRARH